MTAVPLKGDIRPHYRHVSFLVTSQHRVIYSIKIFSCIELLGDRDEGYAMAVEQLDELGKVRQRSGQAVDLVDHDDVHLTAPDVSQQPLQRRPLGRASRIAAVIVA